MRFYHPLLEKDSESLILSKEESIHCTKVLRMKSGMQIEIINGRGLLSYGIIEIADPKACQIKIVNCIEKENTKKIHIAIAPTKQMERLEWFLEKSVELGLTELSLLKCQNNERDKCRLDRLEKIAISAMKQSKRYFLPKINPLTPLKNFLEANPEGYIAHCANSPKTNMNEIMEISTILIGPEGDFSEEEIKLANRFGYKSISLGAYRLRTETAALYGVSALSLLTKP